MAINPTLLNIQELPTYKAAAGAVPNYSRILTRANALNVTETEVDIIDGGVLADYVHEEFTLESDSALDTVVEYEVNGLDENFDRQSTSVMVTGITPVSVPGAWTRIFSMTNISGTSRNQYQNEAVESVGNIILKSKNFAVTHLTAIPEDQSAFNAGYTIPKGFIGFIKRITLSVNKATGTTEAVLFKLQAREFGGVFIKGADIGLQSNSTTFSDITFDPPIPLQSKQDIKVTARNGSQGADVTAGMDIVLIKQQEIFQ